MSTCAREGVRTSADGASYALCGDTVCAKRREVAKDIGPDPRWKLLEYCQECGGIMEAGRIITMAKDGENVVMYDRNNFQRNTTLGAWMRR